MIEFICPYSNNAIILNKRNNMTIYPYNDDIAYVTDDCIVDTNNITIDQHMLNANEENRINTVTSIAAVTYGKVKANNPHARYNKLLVEAAPKLQPNGVWTTCSPVRPFEFIPVKLGINYKQVLIPDSKKHIVEVYDISNGNILNTYETAVFNNTLGRYGYVVTNDDISILYTNMRACVNAGIEPEDVPYVDSKEFKILKLKLPMFVWAQLKTHTRLSMVAQSDRVSAESEYWLPNNFMTKCVEFTNNNTLENVMNNVTDVLLKRDIHEAYVAIATIVNEYSDSSIDDKLDTAIHRDIVYSMLNVLTQNEVQEIFKLLGYKMEIYSRAMYYFKYKVFYMAGWVNDPDTYLNLLLERGSLPEVHTNWVQPETMVVAEAIKKIINYEIV